MTPSPASQGAPGHWPPVDDDAALQTAGPVEVTLLGDPGDVGYVYEALTRAMATSGLTPPEQISSDPRRVGRTTVIAADGPSMTRDHDTGARIPRPAYAEHVQAMADHHRGDAPVSVRAATAVQAAMLCGELADRLGQYDPLGRLAARTA